MSAPSPAPSPPAVVEVSPATFETVYYDADRIAAVASSVAALLGLGHTPIRIEVDEDSPLSYARLRSVDPVVIAADGGAFEDPARLRRLAEDRVAEEVGRLLLRVLDRRTPAFAGAPDEDALSSDEEVAWDAAALGRLERSGIRVHAKRRRYQFLVRHGFTDVADAALRRLWDADRPTWDDIAAVCAATAAARGSGTD